jgi:hypothetical protein
MCSAHNRKESLSGSYLLEVSIGEETSARHMAPQTQTPERERERRPQHSNRSPVERPMETTLSTLGFPGALHSFKRKGLVGTGTQRLIRAGHVLTSTGFRAEQTPTGKEKTNSKNWRHRMQPHKRALSPYKNSKHQHSPRPTRLSRRRKKGTRAQAEDNHTTRPNVAPVYPDGRENQLKL